MSAWFADLRAAVRSLRTSSGFAAMAVVTLGGGLAMAVTVMTVVNAYLLRSMPYPAADRLYSLSYAPPGQWGPEGLRDVDWSALGDVIETPIAWDLDVFFMLGGGSAGNVTSRYPESVQGAWVTPGYVEGFGIRTAMGRTLQAADYDPASPPVAVISHRLWQSRFQGDPSIVGRTFTAYVSDRPDEAETIAIVGVLPTSHWHFNAYTDVLAPLRAEAYPYYVRLREGVSTAVAVDRISSVVRAALPTVAPDWRVTAVAMQEQYTAHVRPMLWSVAAGATLVLLIAGANVAVLLLVRGRRRERDFAVRLALGAGRGRLVRMLALEGLLLGLAATAAGVGAGRVALATMAPAIESFLGRRVPGGVDTLAIDTTVLWLTAATALGIVLVFTVLPLAVLRLSRPGLTLGHDRSGGESRGSRRARSFLIGVEVAASLTLLSGAALMVRSAIGMLDVDFGLEADRVATSSLATRQRSYPDAASQAAFVERVSAAIAGIGGSTATGIGNWWPLQPAPRVPVRAMAGAADPTLVGVQAVTGGYFGALGIRTWDGRVFDARDTAAGEPVVVVSESLAGRMWAGAPAVGQSLVFHNSEGRPTATRRVIGVVNDVRQTHTDEDWLDAYVPFPQQPGHFAYIYVRNPQASGWETDLREAVGAVDIEAATGTPRWLGVMLEGERAAPRFLARLLGVFAVVASLLALVGLHGVIAYATEQRRHEIAIRVAVGASPRDVSRLFVRQGALVLAGGVLAGVWGATALGRLLETYLHDVAPADPAALASAAALFTACGLAAIWWPARRAAAREPHGILGGN